MPRKAGRGEILVEFFLLVGGEDRVNLIVGLPEKLLAAAVKFVS